MLAIEIELLAGRYAATAYNNRRRAEWPPHPARFFSALVSALHDRDTPDADERAALLWLERQPAPALAVDLEHEVARRRVLDLFVPVNDLTLVGDPERALREARAYVASIAGQDSAIAREQKNAEKSVAKEEKKLAAVLAGLHSPDPQVSQKAMAVAAAILPAQRTRQVRTFPVVIPARPVFTFTWSNSDDSAVRAALDRLCSRVARLGHSSSLVRCRITNEMVEPTLVPSADGEYVLRTIGPGQLERLEHEFSRHLGVESRVLPAIPQAYAPPRSARIESVRSAFSDEWIIFERIDGGHPMSSRTTVITRALRAALIEQHGSETLPAVISGHSADGLPVDHTHVAFIALPFVGQRYADGSLKGLAVVIPRGITRIHRQQLLQLIAWWERDRSNGGVVELGGTALNPVRFRREAAASQWTTRALTWCRPSRRFITATPIALDRNPGDLRSNRLAKAHKAAREAQETVSRACEFIGLPRPASVEISLVPLLAGAQPTHDFRNWPLQPGRHPRVHVHADIRFAELVRGPVILGAGRYFGLGLCLPVDEEVGS
jgi:CRISPR-associated protein Csb2